MRPLESGDPARLGRFELLGEGGQGIVYLGPLRDGDLQRLATGRLAFGGDTVQVVIYRILYEEPDLSSLPPSLLPVIQQCLSKDPRQRPAAVTSCYVSSTHPCGRGQQACRPFSSVQGRARIRSRPAGPSR